MRKVGSFVSLTCILQELWSLKCEKWFIVVSSGDDSKKSVTAWVKYVSASER